MLIPDGEHVITFLMRVKYADPTELSQTLGTFVVQSAGQYTNITPLPKAGALLITENTAVIRQVLRIIPRDRRAARGSGQQVLRARKRRRRGRAKEARGDPEQAERAGHWRPGVAAGNRPVAPAPRIATTPDGQPVPPGTPGEGTATTIEVSAGGPNEDNIVQGKIKITADKRTNRIHVVTRPANMALCPALIREFDANVKFGTPTTRPLKYVSASDVLKVAVKAISDPGAKDDAGGAGGSNKTGGQGNNRSGQNGSNGSLFGNNSGDSSGSGGGGGSGGTDFNVSEGLSTESVDTTPEAVTVGNTRIIADKRANSIIVVGSEDVKQKLFKVIDELDKRAPQGDVSRRHRRAESERQGTVRRGLHHPQCRPRISPIVIGSGGTGTGNGNRYRHWHGDRDRNHHDHGWRDRSRLHQRQYPALT